MKKLNEIEAKLDNLFSQNMRDDNIVAVLLFGSRVGEYFSSESDIDVAILLNPLLSKDKQKGIISEIYEKLPYYFIEPVDLINLNQANYFLSYQILTRGKVILCRNKREYKKFRGTRLLQYPDFKKFLERFYPKIFSRPN